MGEFRMPALGADMATGRLVEWRVRPGGQVRAGDVVAVVETHKGAIDVECFLEGVIGDMVPLGTELPVGAVLARVGEPGEHTAADGPASTSAVLQASPPSSASASASMPQLASPPVSLTGLAPGLRARASPAARRRAAELGVEVDRLRGTGTDGAVTLADVERAARAAANTAAVPAPSAPARGGFDPASMRQVIAAAMSRSKREIPHYYLSTTVDFAAAQAWLSAFNAVQPPERRLLPAALFLKAVAVTLRRWPQLNGFHEAGAFRAGAGIHVGWAIALRGGGLVAPAIHDADRLSLPESMQAMRDLIQRARTGGLRSSELSDPTITVTSLGERGAESVFGVIHPPQVAILGFGRVVERPWVVGGQVLPRPVVQLTLAADHRVSDGHLGGQCLAAIDAALQAPDSL